MVLKVRNKYKTCKNLVGITLAIGELRHTEFLKPSFLYALKWAISLVLSDEVTYCMHIHRGHHVNHTIASFSLFTSSSDCLYCSNSDWTASATLGNGLEKMKKLNVN